MAWTLCSKQDVISIHPCKEEELQDFWSDIVEQMIRTHRGQPNLGKPLTVASEYYNGDGTSMLAVRQPPIKSVTSLKVNDLTLTASDYVVFPTYIQLKGGEVFPKGTLNVVLSYESGSNDITMDVQGCAAAMVVAFLNYYRRLGADSSLRFSTPDRISGEETPNQNVGLTSHLQAIMRRMLKKSARTR